MNPENLAAFRQLQVDAYRLTSALGAEFDALDANHNPNALGLVYLMRALAHTAAVFADDPQRPLRDPIRVLIALLNQIDVDIGYTPLSDYLDNPDTEEA